MNKTIKRLAAGTALFAAVGLAYYLGASSASTQEGSTIETAMSAEPRILYWRAPMDPNERYDKPGKSRMGMDLIPVYADTPGATTDEVGIVKIDPAALQRINYATAPVTVERLNPLIRTTGRFVMDETGRTSIALKVEGWVQELHVNFDGAIVHEGQPVLDLYSPALVATQEEYLLALSNLDRLRGTAAESDAERLVDAARRRLQYWDVTQEQIERLERTRTVTPTLTFYAPHAGEVMHLNVAEGQRVPEGHRLMDVVDISRVWLIADLYEEDLSRVTVGTEARIEVRSDPGREYTGVVDHIYHMMNDELRTARARIVLPGRHGGPLKPGMFATAHLEAVGTEPTLVIPENALIRTGERNLVIVSLGGGRFRPQLVEPGLSAQGKVQILDGVEEGDLVVVNAQFLIDSEASLTGVVASMSHHGMPGMDRAPPAEAAPGMESMKGMKGMEDMESMEDTSGMHDMPGMEGMHDMPGMKPAEGTKK